MVVKSLIVAPFINTRVVSDTPIDFGSYEGGADFSTVSQNSSYMVENLPWDGDYRYWVDNYSGLTLIITRLTKVVCVVTSSLFTRTVYIEGGKLINKSLFDVYSAHYFVPSFGDIKISGFLERTLTFQGKVIAKFVYGKAVRTFASEPAIANDITALPSKIHGILKYDDCLSDDTLLSIYLVDWWQSWSGDGKPMNQPKL
ncbi:hypothetical protein SNR37_003159 [Agarivorans aestuarii]|uniref:Uncharacterized protein n=1 Tax=Agarivorans aestuarii TaxID=1563703 RepID=A0ABU7G2W7_9ALTE|nr:hypothetical protein [Agarivorans aestuarii]MEE1673732.1 hypothetical protein [Agarivorans aestuarii]